MSWMHMSVNLDVPVNYACIWISIVTNPLRIIHACIGLYRIEELEINLRNMNDAINEEKLQHEHQVGELHKR